MTKSRKKILVWILVWAGLLIGILYSPVGSPHFYSSHKSHYEFQNASFNNGPIQNAPKLKYNSDNNSFEFTVPDIHSISKANYAATNYQPAIASSQSYSYGSNQTRSYQNNSSSAGGGMGGGSFIASGGSRSSSGSSGITMTNGIAAIGTTSNLSSANKQSVTAVNTSLGGTDPGDDPTGNPIPVGEGWELLVLFGGVYVFIKMKPKSFTI